jgi:hypothetical protein
MNPSTCQSCGKPIKKAVDRGTNLNGSLSPKYCAQCYSMGEFTPPDITAAQMQERVVGKMREMGLPGFLAKFLARNVPKLERWARPPGPRS